MNDKDVIEYLLKYKQIKWKFLENNIKEYLLNKFNDLYSIKETDKLRESYYRWTIRDVNKRNIAKQNNLNYIEFWNINEVKEWLNKQNS